MPTPPPPIRRTSSTTYQQRLAHQAGAPIKRAVRNGRPPLSGGLCGLAGTLLVLGAALTVAGLFPTYVRGGGSMSAHTSRWLFESVPLVAWVGGGALLARQRLQAALAGTALAAASLVITTGLNLSALLQLAVGPTGLGSARLGFWLITGGDALAVGGALVALAALRRAGGIGRPAQGRRMLAGLSAIIGAALVVGYLPGWRHYGLMARTIRHPETLTTSSPFHGAWEVIVAEVLVAVGLGLVPLIGSQGRNLRVAAAAYWGVALGVGGLLTLNVIEVVTATPETFVPHAEVVSLHVGLTASMTPGFWLEAAAVAALVVLGTALALRPVSANDERQPGI